MLRTVLILFGALPTLTHALTVVGTSNRAGELEPCGCQVNQIGGLNRMAEWLSTQSKTDEVVVADSGDSFFSAPVLPDTRKVMEKQRALTLSDAYREMGVRWMTPGERDLALGVEFLKELGKRSGLKFIVSNVKGSLGEGFQIFDTYKSKSGKIGIIGLVSPDVFGDEIKVADPVETLEILLKEFREKAIEQVVVLSHLGLQEDRKIIAKFKNLLVIGSHSLDPIAEQNFENKSGLLQPQHEGQQIGVFINGKAELIELSKKWDKENSVSRLVRHYHEVRGIAKANEKVKPVLATSKKPYVANPHKCKTCHEEQYSFWEMTKHSSAILVLFAKKQHLNPECLVCHSLGLQQPGGYASPKKAGPQAILEDVFQGDKGGSLDSRIEPERYEQLKRKYHSKISKPVYWGTQCEHCHGNRNGHPGVAKTQKKVSAETCIQCHRPPNAPEFDTGMVARVACPLMKKEKGAR